MVSGVFACLSYLTDLALIIRTAIVVTMVNQLLMVVKVTVLFI